MSRRVIDLDGEWELAEGTREEVPAEFPSMVPVPGLVDMAHPGFAEVGLNSDLREAFWYRRTFSVDDPLTEFATLRIARARYGTTVYLNGVDVGTHRPNHTPGLFDVSGALRLGVNELVVRLGPWRDDEPTEVPDGRDQACYLAVPGIYDSVQLWMAQAPFLELVKTAPDIESGTVTVISRVRAGQQGGPARISCVVREATTGTECGAADSEVLQLASGEVADITVTVPMSDVVLWTPENPHLYLVDVKTPGDSQTVRFGMRSFTFDRDRGQAMLNGSPYALRGSSACIFRFFEDPNREDRPWRRDWVRNLHRQFKAMNWNTVRHAVGAPPEFWYDVADEEGVLVIDEYPLFYIYTADGRDLVERAAAADRSVEPRWLRRITAPEPVGTVATPSTSPAQRPWPEVITAESLIPEFTEWVESLCNHPSIVLWDSNCEGRTQETTKAVRAVRDLDPQGRPWGDGWNPPQRECDPFNAHWYVQWNAAMYDEPTGISSLADSRKSAIGYPLGGTVEEMIAHLRTPRSIFDGVPVNYGGNAVLLEEYGWMWLTREGNPTRQSQKVYDTLTDWPVATADERRYTRARILAAETEFFRCNRAMAGVLIFCGLSSSHGKSFTTDFFADVATLEYDPYFREYVGDAFAPAGLMVDVWRRELAGGMLHEIPVVAINDDAADWDGYVDLRIVGAEGAVMELRRRVRLPSMGQQRMFFALTRPIPDGEHQIIAELSNDDGYSVKSLRDISVSTAR